MGRCNGRSASDCGTWGLRQLVTLCLQRGGGEREINAGVQLVGHTMSTARKWREIKAGVQFAFFLYYYFSVQDRRAWDRFIPLAVGPSSSGQPQETPSQTHLDVCLLGDSQAGDHDQWIQGVMLNQGPLEDAAQEGRGRSEAEQGRSGWRDGVFQVAWAEGDRSHRC